MKDTKKKKAKYHKNLRPDVTRKPEMKEMRETVKLQGGETTKNLPFTRERSDFMSANQTRLAS